MRLLSAKTRRLRELEDKYSLLKKIFAELTLDLDMPHNLKKRKF